MPWRSSFTHCSPFTLSYSSLLPTLWPVNHRLSVMEGAGTVMTTAAKRSMLGELF